jgi:ABC-type transport system substrate-binding protein
MDLLYRTKRSFSLLIGLVLILVALVAVACGEADAPTSAPAPTTVDTAAEQPTQAPSDAGQPTALPAPTSVPVMAEPEVNPGKLTWMVGSFANERMNYCLAAGGGHDYLRQIHAFLIESGVEDGARVLQPGIATDWSVSPDGTKWTLKIREGIKFQDGSDLTTEDVLWSLIWATGEQATEYVTGGGCINQAQIIESHEQTAPDEITISYKGVFLSFEEEFGGAGGSTVGHIYPAGFGQGPDVLHDVEVESAYDRNPIGAGLFQLVNHVASESMEFDRFDDYFYQPAFGLPEDRRAKFQTLDLRLVPEAATRVAALRAGEADIAPVSLGAKDQIEAGGGRLMFGQEGVYFFARLLGCWEESLPCHDIRVRQALNYAVDRASMRDRLYRGEEVMQVKGFHYVSPSTVGYTTELDPFPFDPDKARELLTQAGYQVPGSSEGKVFPKLTINTWPSTATPNMPEAAQFVGEVWRKELGIDTEVRVSEEAAVKKLVRLTEDGYGQVLFRDNETRLDGSDMLNGPYGRNPDRPDRDSRDPDIVALAEQTRSLVDPVARIPALQEFYLKARNESNHLHMGHVNIPWGVGPRVETWEPYPLAFYVNSLHTITLK